MSINLKNYHNHFTISSTPQQLNPVNIVDSTKKSSPVHWLQSTQTAPHLTLALLYTACGTSVDLTQGMDCWVFFFFFFFLHSKCPKIRRWLYQNLSNTLFTPRYSRVKNHRNTSWRSFSSCFSAALRKINTLKDYKALWKPEYISLPYNSYVHHSEKYIVFLACYRPWL